MAISPNVLKSKMEDELNILEQKIDEILQQQKLLSSEITIKPPSEMSYAHYQKIRDRYLSAGWKNVTWKDDQVDGASLTFSLISPSFNSMNR